MANYLVIPEAFRMPGATYCAQCRAETIGECGHFLDARDNVVNGPTTWINWMSNLPSFDWEAYVAWLRANHAQVRFYQENGYEQDYPDGSSGSIPFLRNLVK